MTDHEILIAAAKGAGIEFFTLPSVTELYVGKADNSRAWNPLERDADAIELALAVHAYDCVVGHELRTWSGSTAPEARAATRRAIVHVAAGVPQPKGRIL